MGDIINLVNGAGVNSPGAIIGGAAQSGVYAPPPHNLEAEQALLGAILVNNRALDGAAHLREEHFFEPLHGRIFEASRRRIEAGRLATPITLQDYFADEEPIKDDLTVNKYMGTLAANATTVINAPEYAQTILDLASRREVMSVAADMAEAARSVDYTASGGVGGAAGIVEEAMSRLDRVGDVEGRLSSVVTYRQAVRQCISDMDAAYGRGDGLVGLSSGIGAIDRMLGGFADSDLTIIAARPGMGKTTLALNIVTSMARSGHAVGVFSLEMAARQLAQKNLATASDVPVQRMRSGDLREDEFRRIIDLSRRQQALPIYIDQQGGVSIETMSMRAKRMKRKWSIKALVVDYIQLMQPEDDGRMRFGNRVQEITKITAGLKALAKELDIPVIGLSQLSRAVENRADRRPMLSDLRESGSIEQDADVVVFVYREEYYLLRDRPNAGAPEYAEWLALMDQARGRAELIVGKARHGPVGTIDLTFNGAKSLFGDGADADGDDDGFGF